MIRATEAARSVLHHAAKILDDDITITFQQNSEALGVVGLSADHQMGVDIDCRCHRKMRCKHPFKKSISSAFRSSSATRPSDQLCFRDREKRARVLTER